MCTLSRHVRGPRLRLLSSLWRGHPGHTIRNTQLTHLLGDILGRARGGRDKDGEALRGRSLSCEGDGRQKNQSGGREGWPAARGARKQPLAFTNPPGPRRGGGKGIREG